MLFPTTTHFEESMCISMIVAELSLFTVKAIGAFFFGVQISCAPKCLS
jgi:hypothetical protein